MNYEDALNCILKILSTEAVDYVNESIDPENKLKSFDRFTLKKFSYSKSAIISWKARGCRENAEEWTKELVKLIDKEEPFWVAIYRYENDDAHAFYPPILPDGFFKKSTIKIPRSFGDDALIFDTL